MESHEELLAWADAQGIELNGIRPDRIPGRGIGIITTRKIKAGEELIRVPVAALRTKFTVAKAVSEKLPANMSVHGLLAADLALDESGKYDEWNAVMPTPQELETMPIAWPPALQEHLPLRARDLLRKQEAKLARDWAVVSEAFPTLAQGQYRHCWMLVNTRTFYFVCPRTEKLGREDRMVLQPVADLLNHADLGCAVGFSEDEFTIRSDRAYPAGEELFICYGNHSNDFLMAEYGFALAEGCNRFDEVCIDDVILPRLSAAQKDLLAEHDFLGNYMLDAETVCFRTEVAVRLMCSPSDAVWLSFVEGLDDGAQAHKEQADRVLLALLQKHRRKIQRCITELERDRRAMKGENKGTGPQLDLLVARWKQIEGLVAAATARLSGR